MICAYLTRDVVVVDEWQGDDKRPPSAIPDGKHGHQDRHYSTPQPWVREVILHLIVNLLNFFHISNIV